MAVAEYKKEKKAHEQLLELLKSHFSDDEKDILDEDFDEMKPMKKNMGLRKGRQESEENEEDFEGEDDDYYDSLTESEEEEDDEESSGELDKERKKRLAIMLITKKTGREDS